MRINLNQNHLFSPDELADIELDQKHEDHMRTDHTGPHGACWRMQVYEDCSCPDPVLDHRTGDVFCACCDGQLDQLRPPTAAGPTG